MALGQPFAASKSIEMIKVSSGTLGAAGATITISGLSGYSCYYILIQGSGSNIGTVQATINGDNSANYNYDYYKNVAADSAASGQTSALVFSTALVAPIGPNIQLFVWLDPDLGRPMIYGTNTINSGSVTDVARFGAGLNVNKASITSVTLVANANWSANTVITVYGIV